MYADAGWTRERTVSALGVALFHAAIGYALLTGLGSEALKQAGARIKVFDVTQPPPPPTEEAPTLRSPEPEGEAAPPNLKSTPAPVVAPPPRVEIERPPPVTAAPVAGAGESPSAGAAQVPGPGTGAGGTGNGLGSGGSGSGTGGGGGGSPARYVSGTIRNADYPRAATRAGAQGTVIARLTIGTDGRVSDCRVTRSSGNADLDSTTCRLIRQRFRYRPALDVSGRPTEDQLGWKQDWWFEAR